MEIESQNKMIQKHLESGRSISPIEALNLYGCFRLASRISDLRHRGLIIKTEKMFVNGKRFASYKLEGVKNEKVTIS